MAKHKKKLLAKVTGHSEFVTKVKTATVARMNAANSSQCCASGTCD